MIGRGNREPWGATARLLAGWAFFIITAGTGVALGLAQRPPEAPSDLALVEPEQTGDRQEERGPRAHPFGGGDELHGSVSWATLRAAPLASSDGRRVGVVTDFLMEVRSGRIAYALVRTSEGVLAAPLRQVRWRGTPIAASGQTNQWQEVWAVLDGEAGARSSQATGLEPMPAAGHRRISNVVEEFEQAARGSQLEFLDCLVDLDFSGAVVFEVRLLEGGVVDRVAASRLVWKPRED